MEGTLRDGLARAGAVPAGAPDLEVASRTDRGVHARANALGLTSALPAAALLRVLNGIDPAIFFTAARRIGPAFSVRTPRRRWYRYFEPLEGRRPERWREAARRFREFIDARSFGRELPRRTPAWRRIESVAIAVRPQLLRVDLKAPSFERGMVRKIVAALRAYDRGRLSLEELDAALAGDRVLTLPLAEPEGLVLWNVEYDVRWTYRPPRGAGPPSRRQRAAREAAIVRAAVTGALSAPDRPPGERTVPKHLK